MPNRIGMVRYDLLRGILRPDSALFTGNTSAYFAAQTDYSRGGRLLRYSLASIDTHRTSLDGGRIIGYDNAHRLSFNCRSIGGRAP